LTRITSAHGIFAYHIPMRAILAVQISCGAQRIALAFDKVSAQAFSPRGCE
jgi:hypothetical protein